MISRYEIGHQDFRAQFGGGATHDSKELPIGGGDEKSDDWFMSWLQTWTATSGGGSYSGYSGGDCSAPSDGGSCSE